MVQTAVLSAYTQAKDHASPPDVVMYNIVLNAWAKAKNAARARQLLESMTTIKRVPSPNAISYNTTINARMFDKGK
jgi:pentatricopeptide repeat protein